MNVLVYSGPGVSASALKQTLLSLKSILSPLYSVQTVLADALSSNVWCPSCALLVVPGGRDVPYLTSLKDANKHIRDYVESGGRYLGLCAGAYYAAANVEWEVGRPDMEVTGPRPLRFFPGISRGCVYRGFEYNSEAGARAVSLLSHDNTLYRGLYYNGGGEFVDAEKYDSVKILARYSNGSHAVDTVAAVHCSYGKGAAALWGTHIEYSLMVEPLNLLIEELKVPEYEKTQWEKERTKLLSHTLASLGLRIPEQNSRKYSRPLPQYFICLPELGNLPSSSINSILANNYTNANDILPDTNDTFHFHDYAPDILDRLQSTYGTPSNDIEAELAGPKHVILCNQTVPRKEDTPMVDLGAFFDYLRRDRHRASLPSPSSEEHGIGSVVLYSEAVTSTQTLLDK